MQAKYLKAVLEAANKGYENGELYLDEDTPRGERGDTLADFVASEIREVTEGCEDFESTQQAALDAMNSALRQLQDVVSAIENVELPREVEQSSFLELVKEESPGLLRSISDDDLCADCQHLVYRPGDLSVCELATDNGWPGVSDSDGYVQSCEKFAKKTD